MDPVYNGTLELDTLSHAISIFALAPEDAHGESGGFISANDTIVPRHPSTSTPHDTELKNRRFNSKNMLYSKLRTSALSNISPLMVGVRLETVFWGRS